MGESLLLYERCLAIQLARESPPPSRPPAPDAPGPTHHHPPQQRRTSDSHAPSPSRRPLLTTTTTPHRPPLPPPLTRPQSLPDQCRGKGQPHDRTSPSDSDTPTPTNCLECPTQDWSQHTAASLASLLPNDSKNKITNYQDGYLLFLVSGTN